MTTFDCSALLISTLEAGILGLEDVFSTLLSVVILSHGVLLSAAIFCLNSLCFAARSIGFVNDAPSVKVGIHLFNGQKGCGVATMVLTAVLAQRIANFKWGRSNDIKRNQLGRGRGFPNRFFPKMLLIFPKILLTTNLSFEFVIKY